MSLFLCWNLDFCWHLPSLLYSISIAPSDCLSLSLTTLNSNPWNLSKTSANLNFMLSTWSRFSFCICSHIVHNNTGHEWAIVFFNHNFVLQWAHCNTKFRLSKWWYCCGNLRVILPVKLQYLTRVTHYTIFHQKKPLEVWSPSYICGWKHTKYHGKQRAKWFHRRIYESIAGKDVVCLFFYVVYLLQLSESKILSMIFHHPVPTALIDCSYYQFVSILYLGC